MKQYPRASKTPFILSQSLQRRLNMYALAASAAGVSLLASAQPSEAKVVYTKAHQVIGTNGVYNLDLNHDGIIDFLVLESGYATFNGTRGNNTLLAKEALGNAVEGRIGNGRQFAAALKRGARIGPGEHFIRGGSRGETMAATWASDGSGGPTTGQWVNVNSRYLGLKFKVGGKIHYGWARLTVQLPGNFLINATLTGYAYETVPGKEILAGQTADQADDGTVSLRRLALGAGSVVHGR
ncbi:MAG TPA: hypothetical protein VN948_01090 [Terriglobales bacterium]|nr:hypothetical protein [Terriglobales bacterium]